MITIFKTFENKLEPPQVGDYVKLNLEYTNCSVREIKNFYKYPCQIIHIVISQLDNKLRYLIEYNTPEGKSNRIYIPIENIIYYAKSLKKLELKINSEKYNL